MDVKVWIVRDSTGDRNLYRLFLIGDQPEHFSTLIDLDLETAVKLCRQLTTLTMSAA